MFNKGQKIDKVADIPMGLDHHSTRLLHNEGQASFAEFKMSLWSPS